MQLVCGIADYALWWSVLVSTSFIPTNISLCVPALYGMATALRRVIGYWADCLACRPFFHPFVVSFFQSPLPIPLSSQLLFTCTWTHKRARRLKMLAHTSLHNFHCSLFRAYQYPHTVHTAEEHCVKAHARS